MKDNIETIADLKKALEHDGKVLTGLLSYLKKYNETMDELEADEELLNSWSEEGNSKGREKAKSYLVEKVKSYFQMLAPGTDIG